MVLLFLSSCIIPFRLSLNKHVLFSSLLVTYIIVLLTMRDIDDVEINMGL